MNANKLLAYLRKDGWLLLALFLCVVGCLALGTTDAPPDSQEGRIGRVLSSMAGAGQVEVFDGLHGANHGVHPGAVVEGFTHPPVLYGKGLQFNIGHDTAAEANTQRFDLFFGRSAYVYKEGVIGHNLLALGFG